MRKQRNMFQTKEQDKTLEELNEVETVNLLEKEFRVVTIKMIKELRRIWDEQSEKFLTKSLKYKEGSEMNNTVLK